MDVDECIETIDHEHEDPQSKSEYEKLNKIIEEQKKIRHSYVANTLPHPDWLRVNHNLLSVCCEGHVANELE